MIRLFMQYGFPILAVLWLSWWLLSEHLNAADACDIQSLLQQQRFEENLAIKQRAIEQCLADGGRVSDLDDNGFSIMSVSIVLSDFEAMRFLLEADVDPNLEDADGSRPLHTLVRRETLAWPIWKHLAERLMASGAEVNAADHNGDTALHYAALLESGTDRVRFLLDHAADPNITNKRGQTPLFSTLQGSCKSAPGTSAVGWRRPARCHGRVLERYGAGRQRNVMQRRRRRQHFRRSPAD